MPKAEIKLTVPKLEDEELLRRYNRVKPVVEHNGKKYFIREYDLEDLKNRSFIWFLDEDLEEEVNSGMLVPIAHADMHCLHDSSEITFRPTVGEVLAQIPRQTISKADAFEIVQFPDNTGKKPLSGFEAIAHENGYMLSVVRFYTLK